MEAKNEVLDQFQAYQRQFAERAGQAGAEVHEASTAEEAREMMTDRGFFNQF